MSDTTGYYQLNFDLYQRKQSKRKVVANYGKLVDVWPLDDIYFLIENYRKMGFSELAESLHRTEISIKTKASELGIFRNRNFPSIPRLTDKQIGYIAGMIDGEGTLYLGQNKYGSYITSIHIANTHRGTLEKMQLWLGFGRVTRSKRREYKSLHLLWFTMYESFVLNRLIRNSLIIKRKHAELLDEAIELLLNHKYRKSPEILAHLMGIHHEIKVLNKRGISAVQ